MQLTQAPLRLPPHTCVVTGREDGEMIDFGATPACDQAPAIVIKREVIEEAATKLCGMVPAKKVEALADRLLYLGEELEKTQKLLKATEELESLLPEKETVNA